MASRLHLKLFYLRTRVRREPQGVTAKKLGVRPATMSHLEQGRSLPTLSMLLVLCKHYDVTPNYLLDDDRPIELHHGDQWSERGIAIARGDWLEVPEGALVRTADGMVLCPLGDGAKRLPATQHAQRLLCTSRAEAEKFAQSRVGIDGQRDQELEKELRDELLAQRKPRGGKAREKKDGGGAPQ